MEIKHIRWIAVVGLIAIVELQYVWLVNTYKLTKESIQMKGEELFPEAALQEVFLRVSKTKKDSTVTMNVNFDAEKDMETMSNPGQWLMSYMHVSFQEIALKDFNRDVLWIWIRFMRTCSIRLASLLLLLRVLSIQPVV